MLHMIFVFYTPWILGSRDVRKGEDGETLRDWLGNEINVTTNVNNETEQPYKEWNWERNRGRTICTGSPGT